ncbi:MAG: STAS domain-containing protein [Magnetococcales bacterium]|nr:STAS domain-containing protein [Magnetococcales bacterium]
MIDFSIDESSSTGTLTLSGDLSIQFAATLKETLLDGISNADSMVINMEQVDRIDLSTVQLLCAAHRALKKANKKLVIAGGISKAVKETIAEAGFIGCMGDGDSSGLWTEERN